MEVHRQDQICANFQIFLTCLIFFCALSELAKYFVSQLRSANSPLQAMMAVEGTAFKVPQQAAYRPQDGMDTYATEYTITYNLESGDVVFKYTGEDWNQSEWNFKRLFMISDLLENPLYENDLP